MGAAESKMEGMDSNGGLDSKETESNEVVSSGNNDFLIDRKSVSNCTSETGASMKNSEVYSRADTDNGVKLERVDDSLIQAMIMNYFTQGDFDHNLLGKYDGLWLKGSEGTAENLKEETSSNFSQLSASNFIRLGPSLIGYPASSWFQNGAPVIPLEESSGEQEGMEPKPVQIWITQQSHSSPQVLKSDIFLKMCAVQIINRQDLLLQHRAYLNIDGNIEYLSKDAEKEGISDFVDHFQKTGHFELNVKEYSASWESIIRALTLKPMFVNDVQDKSNSKHEYQYIDDFKEHPNGEQNRLEDVTVETNSSEESSNQMCKSDAFENGTAGNSNDGEVDEAPGDKSSFDLASSFSGLSIEQDGDPLASMESMLRDSPFFQIMIDDLAKVTADKVFKVLDDSEVSREELVEESSNEGTDSESSDSGETSSMSKSSSETLMDGEMSDEKTESSKKLYRMIREEDLRRQEEVSVSSLPDSLWDMGFGIFNPQDRDVISKLSSHTDTYWQNKKKHPKPINVIRSCDEVASSLMKALEKTSSKTKKATKGAVATNNSPAKSKGSSTNDKSAESSKPNGTAKEHLSPQSPSSSSTNSRETKETKKVNWKKRKAGKKNVNYSTSDESVKSPSSPNVRKVAGGGKTHSKPTKGSSGKTSQDKVLDEGVVVDEVVQKRIPSFLGKLPAATQGFARHSAGVNNSQSDLVAALKPKKTTSAPGLRGTTAKGSNLPVEAVPSTSKTSAPPMGAIPVRAAAPLEARSLPQKDSLDAKVLDQFYSNRLEEFGCLVMQSMWSMTIEQQTHAINIIFDVLVEGNNNSLCQYTRLSGIRNEPESGKEVFRMGPSHVSDASGTPGSSTEQPSMSYGFPQSLPAASCPSYPIKEPSLGGSSQTQSLPIQKQPTKQKAASNQGDPTTQSKPHSGQNGKSASSKRRSKDYYYKQLFLHENNRTKQQNKKVHPKETPADKVTRTRNFYPSEKPPRKQRPTPAGSDPKQIQTTARKTHSGTKQTQTQNHQDIPNPPATSQKSAHTPQSPTTKPKSSYWALKKQNQKLKKALKNNS